MTKELDDLQTLKAKGRPWVLREVFMRGQGCFVSVGAGLRVLGSEKNGA